MDRSDTKVGVLSFHNSKETKSLLNVADEMGFDPVWIYDRNLRIKMEEDGLEVYPEVDVVLNRMLLSNTQSPIELLGVADAIQQQDVPMLNPPNSVVTVLNKIASTSALSNMKDVSVPNSFFSVSKKQPIELDGHNEIQKRAIGTHGNSVNKVENEDSMISNINGNYAFVQEKVDQKGQERDLRVYVVGDEIVSVIERVSSESEWRTNIARGATANEKEISDSLEKKVIQVINYFDIDYAGVDVMINKEGKPMVLEVNPTAGFKGLYNATGTNPAPYMIREAVNKLGHNVGIDEAKKYDDKLDDSIPDCKPSKQKYDKPKIGIVEDTNVAGYSDQIVVESKVDTGATRTSIDIELASNLGLGPIKDHVSVRTGSSKESKKRPVVPLSLKLSGLEHQIDVSVEDREHMEYDLILGRDILQDYQIVPELNDNISQSEEE